VASEVSNGFKAAVVGLAERTHHRSIGERANSEDSMWEKSRIAVVLLALLLIVGWHLYVVSRIQKESQNGSDFSISLNPITDHVRIGISKPAQDEGEPANSLSAGLITMAIAVMQPAAERAWNDKARQRLDLYAIIVPYGIEVSMQPRDPTAVAQLKARELVEKQAAAAKATTAAKEARAYIDSNLRLENVRISTGENFGRTVWGIFGTVVNKGNRTLNRVKKK
jgi:hypothetical protein